MKKMTLRLLSVLCFVVMSIVGFAQDKKTVSGNIRDNNGVPLAGATVGEKGTNNRVLTDQNGNYSIRVSPQATLVISFVGYGSQEIQVPADGNLPVVLESSGGSMTEVVVTGFGVRKQTRKLAYSVTEVKGEELTRANTPNIVNALQGKVPGVMINTGAGGPQASSRIRIRGNSSLRPNTQPLFVIDGVLIQPGTTGADSWGDAADFGNEIKNLNPDDYESVTVLKGSAASALYGSQAQNGVIIITTKKGRTRKGLGVSVTHTQSFERAYRAPKTQDVFGAGINPTFAKDANGNDIVDPNNFFWSFGPKFDGREVIDIDGRKIRWEAKPNNLLDAYQTGRFMNTNVAVEGGNELTTFRASFSNLRNSSVVPNNKLTRNNFNIRATQKLGRLVTVDAGVNYAVSNGLNPILQGGNSNPVFSLLYFTPRNYDTEYWMDRYEDPTFGGINQQDRYGLSGLWWRLFNNNQNQREDQFRGNLDVTVNVLPWLNAVVRSNYTTTAIENENKQLGTGIDFAGGYYSLLQSQRRQSRVQALLNANRDLNTDFALSLSIGGETQRYEPGNSIFSESSGGLKVPGRYYLANSRNTPATRVNSIAGSRIDALYAFGDVTWKDMLTLTFSARNDWNSTLAYPDGTGDMSYFYPSVGLSWIFSETMGGKTDFLSFGKLRASLGYTGYATNPYETSRGKYIYLGEYTDRTGQRIPRYGFQEYLLGNNNLKNELSREIEFGTDLRFFDNRIGIDVAWYKKNTFNQILSLALPSTSGVDRRIINAGNIQNKGIEISLNAVPVRTRDMEWNTTVNFTRNRNKIIELAEGVTDYELDLAFGADMRSVARVGGDYATILTGYGFASYQKKDASGNPIDHPMNGKRMIRTNGAYWRSQDAGQGQKELGSAMEKFLLSNLHTLRYKAFTLGVQVDAKVGGLLASATHQYGSTNGTLEWTLFGRDAEHGGVTFTDATGVTRNDGIIPDGVFADGTKGIGGADIGGMTFADAVAKGYQLPIPARLYYARLTQWSTGIREFSTFENSWVAVREVSIGYNLPNRFAQKLRFNQLRMNIVGRNLGYLYTTLPEGFNPESIFSNRAGTFAEYGGLPLIRNIGVTLNAGF